MSVFISQLVPEGKELQIKGIAQAGMNFCHNFIKAINPVKVYALLLISERKKQIFSFENKNIRFIQIRFFPHIGLLRAFNAFLENLLITYRIVANKENNIWFYNINAHNIIAYAILKFIFFKKCFIIIADFSIDLFIFRCLLPFMRRADGIISFSQNTANLFAQHQNFIVKAGILNLKGTTPKMDRPINKTKFLFSGSLNPHAGIDLALEFFSGNSDLELIITGEGKGAELVRTYKNHPNIVYLGYLSYQDYLKVLSEVDIVLSLRDTSFSENQYNFPSKIIEYLYNEKVVISTIPYQNIDASVYFITQYSQKALSDTIREIVNTSDEVLKQKCSKAKAYVVENFSYHSWQTLVKQTEENAKRK